MTVNGLDFDTTYFAFILPEYQNFKMKTKQEFSKRSVVVSSSDKKIDSTMDLTACNKCHMCRQSFFNTNSTFTSFVDRADPIENL